MAKHLKENLRVRWTGTNFPEIYEWLIDESITRDLTLRVLDPGNRNSPIQIKIGSLKLRLNIGDWIEKDCSGLYYIIPGESNL